MPEGSRLLTSTQPTIGLDLVSVALVVGFVAALVTRFYFKGSLTRAAVAGVGTFLILWAIVKAIFYLLFGRGR